MGKLSDLKTAAAAKLGAAQTEVTTYITALEGSVSTNKYWIAGGAIIGALLGWFAHKL